MNNSKTFWKDLKSGHFVSMVKEASQGQTLSNSQEVYNVMKPLFAENDDVETVLLYISECQKQNTRHRENIFRDNFIIRNLSQRIDKKSHSA